MPDNARQLAVIWHRPRWQLSSVKIPPRMNAERGFSACALERRCSCERLGVDGDCQALNSGLLLGAEYIPLVRRCGNVRPIDRDFDRITAVDEEGADHVLRRQLEDLRHAVPAEYVGAQRRLVVLA